MTRPSSLADLASIYDSQPISGMRNRVINGDMRIAQRGTGAVSAIAAFPVDRFWLNHSFDGTVNAQQSNIAPPGYTNSLGFTVATPDTSLGASQFFNFRQVIEGFNIADFGFGAAGAQTIVLSFWARSSVTGTYALSITNNLDSRVYPTSYNINSANTWEYKTITIPGDTAGTWLTNNGTGLNVMYHLALGSSFQGTGNTWNASSIYGPSGTLANWIGTNGATFNITGVQLEAGAFATPFERRSFGQELMLCQRYYSQVKAREMWGAYESTTNIVLYRQNPVPMRGTPTVTRLATVSCGSIQGARTDNGSWGFIGAAANGITIAFTANATGTFALPVVMDGDDAIAVSAEL